MVTYKKTALVRVLDAPNGVSVKVRPGVPLSDERRFWHDDNFAYEAERHDDVSLGHRQALRDAAEYAADLAKKHHCNFETNY